MKLSHTLKLPTAQQYEMRHIYAEVDKADLPEPLQKELTYAEQWRVLQFVVNQQAMISAVLVGLVPMESAAAIMDRLKLQLLHNGLYEKIQPYGMV